MCYNCTWYNSVNIAEKFSLLWYEPVSVFTWCFVCPQGCQAGSNAVPVIRASMNMSVLVNPGSVGCVLHLWPSASACPREGGDVSLCACVWCEPWMWELLGAEPCLWLSGSSVCMWFTFSLTAGWPYKQERISSIHWTRTETSRSQGWTQWQKKSQEPELLEAADASSNH